MLITSLLETFILKPEFSRENVGHLEQDAASPWSGVLMFMEGQ